MHRQLSQQIDLEHECWHTAGDPDLDTTAKALIALNEAGCDVIELGVPYSDPLADGPTIQGAADRALRKGTSLQSVIDMLSRVSDRLTAPIVLFTYYNPIMARGLDRFCVDVRAAGASGLLVPDIPLEETTDIREAVNRHNMELVLLTTPTTGTALSHVHAVHCACPSQQNKSCKLLEHYILKPSEQRWCNFTNAFLAQRAFQFDLASTQCQAMQSGCNARVD